MDALKAIDTAIQCANEGYMLEHYEIVSLESARAAIAELIRETTLMLEVNPVTAAEREYYEARVRVALARVGGA